MHFRRPSWLWSLVVPYPQLSNAGTHRFTSYRKLGTVVSLQRCGFAGLFTISLQSTCLDLFVVKFARPFGIPVIRSMFLRFGAFSFHRTTPVTRCRTLLREVQEFTVPSAPKIALCLAAVEQFRTKFDAWVARCASEPQRRTYGQRVWFN